MSGLNLHAVARGAVTALHPDETVTLLRATGQAASRGVLIPVYEPPCPVSAQIQSLGDDSLYLADLAGRSETTRAAYLFGSPEDGPAPLVRPLARGGDMLRREDGSWWLVTALREDFTASGWVSVSLTLQIAGPDLSACPWHQEEP